MSDKADKQLGREVAFDKGERGFSASDKITAEKERLESALPLPFQVVSGFDKSRKGVFKS